MNEYFRNRKIRLGLLKKLKLLLLLLIVYPIDVCKNYLD
jgi:hypothetical protein